MFWDATVKFIGSNDPATLMIIGCKSVVLVADVVRDDGMARAGPGLIVIVSVATTANKRTTLLNVINQNRNFARLRIELFEMEPC